MEGSLLSGDAVMLPLMQGKVQDDASEDAGRGLHHGNPQRRIAWNYTPLLHAAWHLGLGVALLVIELEDSAEESSSSSSVRSTAAIHPCPLCAPSNAFPPYAHLGLGILPILI